MLVRRRCPLLARCSPSLELGRQSRSRDSLSAALRRRFPYVGFVWLMGADGLADLPRWRRWHKIVRLVSFAVLPRPTYNRAALAGQAAVRLKAARRPAREAPILAMQEAPSWIFLPAPQNDISATELRARRQQT